MERYPPRPSDYAHLMKSLAFPCLLFGSSNAPARAERKEVNQDCPGEWFKEPVDQTCHSRFLFLGGSQNRHLEGDMFTVELLFWWY